ncbi:MAG: UDP-N-acetylmuramoylalanine--D-glutamate ligase [Candidatus Gallionella acididurans]|uniref:UDP-N-acetylmuramoylalanine--D-glutamate ligase n=1 Tax=Candidatus Gallionella acididurans TaxID=1796491 RepID=A0A139BWL8_9PROT|nr:MAG: UDP-N-acetylmuramoylalanine--D-glutamate ligase [Candidatus Gallionella acididurans]
MSRHKNKSVLVLGLGETGLSMVRWLSAQGAYLRVADSRSAPPGLAEVRRYVASGQVFCGEFNDALFEGIELIAISPGVPLRDPAIARAVARGIEVTGDIELFSLSLPDVDRPRILAITGSNGKTTVTTMVEHLCKAAGRDAVAAGNISPAVLDVVMERGANQPEIWVLELSSFQLETTSHLHADAATVLNISEDHLDRYAGMAEYSSAKARIFAGCKVQVLNRDDARCMSITRKGYAAGCQEPSVPPSRRARAECRMVTFGLGEPGSEGDFGIVRDGTEVWLVQGAQRLLKAGELQVAGLHNAANALAALALCRAIDLPMPVLLDALRSFKGLPHRVERVKEIGGVIYYDDSKGTNVGATIAALQGLGRKAVLIAGGEGKGQDFAPLNPVVAEHARAVVLIGRDAPLIADALNGSGVKVALAGDMGDAVQQASRLAHDGDAVLLSPACASFDMFRNYAHRAEVFVAAVNELKLEGAWHQW